MNIPEKDFSDSLDTLPLPLQNTCTEVIIQIHQSRSALSNLDEFINQAVHIIHNHFPLHSVNLYLIDPSRDSAMLRAATGEASQMALAQGHKLPVDDHSMIGKAIIFGKSQVTSDDNKQQGPFPSVILPPIHSELVVPLKAQAGDIVGALDIQSRDYDAFNLNEVTAFQSIANQITKILLEIE